MTCRVATPWYLYLDMPYAHTFPDEVATRLSMWAPASISTVGAGRTERRSQSGRGALLQEPGAGRSRSHPAFDAALELPSSTGGSSGRHEERSGDDCDGHRRGREYRRE